MDFKKLLKSKYFISICILGVVILVFAALSELHRVFYILALLCCTALCVLVAVRNILKYKEVKNNNDAELLPLTQAQRELVKRNKMSNTTTLLLKAIMFIIFAIMFFALVFNW